LRSTHRQRCATKEKEFSKTDVTLIGNKNENQFQFQAHLFELLRKKFTFELIEDKN